MGKAGEAQLKENSSFLISVTLKAVKHRPFQLAAEVLLAVEAGE